MAHSVVLWVTVIYNFVFDLVKYADVFGMHKSGKYTILLASHTFLTIQVFCTVFFEYI